MAGGYRYSAALDKTYTEKQQQQQRWAPSTQNLPVRTVPIIRAAPGPSDPLRFIKTSQAPIVRQARELVQASESQVRKQQHAKLDEQEEQWQTVSYATVSCCTCGGGMAADAWRYQVASSVLAACGGGLADGGSRKQAHMWRDVCAC